MKGWIAAREMDRGKGREGIWDRRKKDMRKDKYSGHTHICTISSYIYCI